MDRVAKLSEAILSSDSEKLIRLLALQDHSCVNTRYEKTTSSSLLHLAVSLDDNKCVEILLLNNADPSIQNSWGDSPLHVAVERGNLKACELLVEFGCNVKARNSQGIEPFDLALEKRSRGIIDCLRSRAYPTYT